MKKSTLALLAAVLVLGAYFAYEARLTPQKVMQVFGGEKKIINGLALSFMEDIRFKDFEKAASYHHPEDREKVDIPKLIERLFRIKPELLDIMEYDILETSLDSTGTRGRVKIKSKVHLLNTEKHKNPELILYFHRRDGQWYMELESSLRG